MTKRASGLFSWQMARLVTGSPLRVSLEMAVVVGLGTAVLALLIGGSLWDMAFLGVLGALVGGVSAYLTVSVLFPYLDRLGNVPGPADPNTPTEVMAADIADTIDPPA